MKITAKETTSALRRIVYPLLKSAGFDDWTSRLSWRRNGGRIEHVEFRSFNAYYAESFNCTPASVDVWIGIHTAELSSKPGTACGPKGPRPREYEMPIRANLAPSLNLPQRSQLNIWKIESIADAESSALDIAEQFRTHGLEWINRSYDAKDLLHFLLQSSTNDFETLSNGARLSIEAGNGDCPNRNEKIAQLAKTLGDYRLAAERFERARWALNMRTGERLLYLPRNEDAELLRLSQECAKLI